MDFNSATKCKEQGIRFWDERTFWHEMIYKRLIPMPKVGIKLL